MIYYYVLFVVAGNGHVGHCNQGNNMYLFPGLVPLIHRLKELHTLFTGCSNGHEKKQMSFFYCKISVCSIGLGVLLSGTPIVSDGMLQAAAEW